MLICKACNTRFAEGPSACPSCGRRAFTSLPSAGDSKASRPAPLAEARRVEEDSQVGRPAKKEPAPVRPARPAKAEAELEELDVLAEAVDPSAADELKPEPSRVRGALSEPGPSVFHLSAAQVRTLVVEQPDLLETGLAIYQDGGEPVGVDYRTPVGAIDLVALDRTGSLVVVMVPDARDVESLMPQVLGRIGYVRKHLAKSGQGVRGVVVTEEVPESLAYAAAGLADTVSFMAYRVALSFHALSF